MAIPGQHVIEQAADAPVGVVGADHLDAADAGARFIRGSLSMTIGYAVNLLLTLAAIPFVIRHLGPARYGQFATVTAVVFIIAGFTDAGLTSLGIREYSNGASEVRVRMLRNLIGLRLTLTAAVLALTMSALAISGAPDAIVVGLLAAGVALLIKLMGDNFGIPLNVGLRLGRTALVGFLYQLTLCGGYLLLVAAGAGVVAMLAAGIPAAVVLLLCTGIIVRRELTVIPSFDLSAWRSMVRETLPFAAAAAVGIIYFREALVLMSFLSSEQQTGYYSAAFRIVEVLTVIPALIATSGLPILARAARDDHLRLRYAVQRLVEVSLILGIWMSASTILGAKLGIAVIAGPQFKPSVPVLAIQGLAIITSFMAAILGFTLLSLREYRPLLWANAIAVAMVTGLAFAFIPAYGAKGAAVVPTIAEASLAVLYAIGLANSRADIRISLRVLPRLAVSLAAGLALAYALPVSSEIIRLIALTCVYFPVLYLLRALPPELVAALRSRPARPRTSS